MDREVALMGEMDKVKAEASKSLAFFSYQKHLCVETEDNYIF